MAQGLQAWDASGKLILDLTDRVARILGTVDTGGTNGSVTDANFASGTPWYLVQSTGGFFLGQALSFSFSGNTLSWTTTQAFRIIYGVY